jgi:hypothetical protein
VAGEHQEDKEGESFVLVWAWRWPCSFWYNRSGKDVQRRTEFRYSDLTMVRLHKPITHQGIGISPGGPSEMRSYLLKVIFSCFTI